MFRRLLVPTLAVTLLLGACAESPTGSSAVVADDYALAMFGEAGVALEGTMGTQAGSRPFDGRSGWPPLPEELRLTDEQRAEIQALREAFRVEHGDALDALRAIFEEARAARRSGASREEVRAILIMGKDIAMALRPHVHNLHVAILAVLTDEQRAWLRENRPRRMPPPIARP